MATRVVEWKKPYTWWKAISIDENKVISLNLRDENNLIIYDSWDDEIYVDLQLPDGIEPTDAFPVGVTTGRVLVADDWDITGTLICAKTTSGDNIKLLYGDDWTLWIDNGTGIFKQIYFKADVDSLISTLTTYINTELAKKQNWVSSDTAPEDPAQWDLWYDSVNDRLMIYDWTSWNLVWWWGWWGSWDVLWPSSAVDWHLAVFDGASWKIIKDWWAVPTVPTNVSDFNNDAGYITGITSWDVTNALWYTPADSSALWTAATKNTWTSSWNVPVLDSNWKLATSTLPWVALTDTFTVSTSSDLTTLSSAEQWDLAIVTTENKTYVLASEPYSTAANWKEILAPTGWVTSVNGQTWAVTLDADDISDSTTTNKFVTATDKSTWSGKQDALTVPSNPSIWHLVIWGWNNKTLTDWWAIPTWVPAVWSNGQVLTVVSWVAAWANASGWDVMVSSQTGNILTSWMKIWAGLESDYQNLGTYDSNCLYLVIE